MKGPDLGYIDDEAAARTVAGSPVQYELAGLNELHESPCATRRGHGLHRCSCSPPSKQRLLDLRSLRWSLGLSDQDKVRLTRDQLERAVKQLGGSGHDEQRVEEATDRQRFGRLSMRAEFEVRKAALWAASGVYEGTGYSSSAIPGDVLNMAQQFEKYLRGELN